MCTLCRGEKDKIKNFKILTLSVLLIVDQLKVGMGTELTGFSLTERCEALVTGLLGLHC